MVGAGSQNLIDGWGGACAAAGIATSCSLVMDTDQRVTFGYRLQHEVTVTIASTTGGQGAVTSTPAGLVCAAGACTGYFDAGEDVALEAAPVLATDRVQEVTGACSTMPCLLTALAGPRGLSVTFERTPCVPSTATCTLGRLTQCDADGQFVTHQVPNGAIDGTAATVVMQDYPCPLSCHATEPRCLDVDAANGVNAALDSPMVSPTGVDIAIPRATGISPGVAFINTDMFDQATSTTTLTDVDGVVQPVPAMVYTQPENGKSIMVLMVRTLTVRAGTTLRATGRRPLAVASHFDVVIAGTVDLAGAPYGGAGACTGACVGLSGTISAGGGGNATGGGGASEAQTAPGVPLTTRIRPLEGGGSGAIGFPSNGGGGLQLVSRVRVALHATGVVNLSGGGGRVEPRAGATGGGAGGNLLIQAPSVQVAPGSVVAGRGGSGAAVYFNGVSTIGVDGRDGPISGSVAAASVTCGNCGTSGTGAIESAPQGGLGTVPGAGTGDADSGAGGGGALGRCAIENGAGLLVIPANVMRLYYIGTTAVATR